MTPSFGHDPSDVATKADLAELRADMTQWRDAMRADMTEWRDAMRADMTEWRDSMRADMTEWRDSMRADIASVRSETRAVNRRMDRLLHTLLAGFLAVAATMIGVFVVIL